MAAALYEVARSENVGRDATHLRYTPRIEPILHLSLPVNDLDASRAFYVDVLGCEPGRVRDRWVDVWFYGMQITLHERPEQVLPAERVGVRHFGVTLSEDALDALVRRVDAHRVQWLHELDTEHAGTPRQQTKAKLLDPSGNVIELKAYAQPSAAFANE